MQTPYYSNEFQILEHPLNYHHEKNTSRTGIKEKVVRIFCVVCPCLFTLLLNCSAYYVGKDQERQIRRRCMVNCFHSGVEKFRRTRKKKNGVQSRLGTQSRYPQLTKLFKWPTQNMSLNDSFLQINSKNLTYTVYSEIRCIALLILQTSKEFWVFLFRQSF